MIKWFVMEHDEVRGPFETEEVKTLQRNSQVKSDDLIWGRLLTEWIQVDDWVNRIDELISKMGIHEDKSRMWHYSLGGDTSGPFSREELVSLLLSVKSISKVHLWTTGMDDWMPIHEFHDIMDDVGINQRGHKRAKIEGTVLVTKTTGDVNTAQLATISEGGIGFYGLRNLFPGEEVTMEVVSPDFKSHLRLKGNVRYISENNFIGVQFQAVHSESKSQIIEYVKKAEEAAPTPIKDVA